MSHAKLYHLPSGNQVGNGRVMCESQWTSHLGGNLAYKQIEALSWVGSSVLQRETISVTNQGLDLLWDNSCSPDFYAPPRPPRPTRHHMLNNRNQLHSAYVSKLPRNGRQHNNPN
jgi:hypothetical protein